MVEQAHRYRLGHPDVDPFDENQVEHRVANHAMQIQVRPDAFRDSSVPLFLSDPDGEPDPGAYLAPLRRKRTASISSRVLMAVMAAAAAAVLLTLLSSEATRSDFVNLRASMAAALPNSSAARSSSSLPTQSLRPPSETAQLPARETPTQDPGSVAMAAVAPTREDIKSAYHSALQGTAPQAAPVPESTIPPVPVRHLDPSEIASALSRATALIASGDLAAARLVLRRAADAGDARSAMTLAETYDPAILGKLGVHGVVPDLDKARGWYEKARQFGATEAAQRLELLASKQN
jgi:TPR repeat protein